MRKAIILFILIISVIGIKISAEEIHIYKNDESKFSMKIYPEYIQLKERKDDFINLVLFESNKSKDEKIVITFCRMDNKMKSFEWEIFNNPDSETARWTTKPLYQKVISKRKMDKSGYSGFSIISEATSGSVPFVQRVELFPKSGKEEGVDIAFWYHKENESKILDMIESIEYNY